MKARNGKFEIEGTPAEMREFFCDKEKATKVESSNLVVARAKRKTHSPWTKDEDRVLLQNWKQPNGQGDRTKYAHNKRVAKSLGRTYDGAHVHYRQLVR